MNKGYFPGWGLDDDTVERLGYKVRGKHNGIVSPYPMELLYNGGKPTKCERGFTFLAPEDCKEKLTLSFAPISKETEKLKKALEVLKEENKYFSFYDNNNCRYINSIDSYTSSYNRYFHFFLSKVYNYYGTNGNYEGLLSNVEDFCFPVTAHDYCIIDNIMSKNNSKIVLKHNKYNFFKEGKKYRNNDEEEYCKIVTKVLTEIMIKYYNYIKYGIDIRNEEQSKLLLKVIEDNYEGHVLEANKKYVKVLKK